MIENSSEKYIQDRYRKALGNLAIQGEKLTEVIKSVCDHEWKRINYGHDKEYFECKKCGKQDWP